MRYGLIAYSLRMFSWMLLNQIVSLSGYFAPPQCNEFTGFPINSIAASAPHFTKGLDFVYTVDPKLNNVCTQVLEYSPVVHRLRPLGLVLGADLPTDDERCCGNLGLSAERILTFLVRYSYRHPHFHALQHALRHTFTAHGTLPYHLRLAT